MALEFPQAGAHGGDLDAARAAYPDAPEPWIDLSTGINPEPYPLHERDLIASARLPQPSQDRALRHVAARRYRADDADMIVAAAGTQALIQILPRLFAPARVAILSPTYSEHGQAWRRERHDVVEVPELSALDDARIVVLVNPNNPTGRVTPAYELRRIAAVLHQRTGLLVVDEAFADVMASDESLIPDLPPATVVLRSFGKAYGLPGLRLGFSVSSPNMAARLRQMLGPWCVSVPAMSVATRALADDAWLDAASANLQSACVRLEKLLASSGCTIIGGTPLFRLVAHPMAHAIADALGRSGIHVRRFPLYPTWLRFGLPRFEQDWQRLANALHATTDDHAIVRSGMQS